MNSLVSNSVAIAHNYPIIREGLSSIINQFDNFHVEIQVANGKTLIKRIERNKKIPNICILNVDIPKASDLSLIIELKEKWPSIHIVIFSMYHDNYSIEQYYQNGVSSFLGHDCNSCELHNALISITEKGKYISKMNPKSKIAHLTPKEKELVNFICSNLTYKEIAQKMGISQRTVETHRDHLFEKFQINSRSALIMNAINFGLLPNNNI